MPMSDTNQIDTKKYFVCGCEVVSRIDFDDVKKGDIGYIHNPNPKNGKIKVVFPYGTVKMRMKDLTNNGFVSLEDRK